MKTPLRIPISKTPFWSPCKRHFLPHLALALVLTSAVFGVACAQGAWSTAQLSQARAELAATSVGTLSIFAGGQCSKFFMIVFLSCEALLITLVIFAFGLRVLFCEGVVPEQIFLMHTNAVKLNSDVVDLYDSRTGLWSTAQLSQARMDISATSVGTVAIFAGGFYSKMLKIMFLRCVLLCLLCFLDVLGM